MMTDSYQIIADLVASVRRKRRMILLLQAVLVSAAMLSGSVLLAGLLLTELSGFFRLILRLLTLSAFFGSVVVGLLLLFLRRENMEATALVIERVNSGLHNALITSLQLVREAEQDGPKSAFSKSLLEQHLAHTVSLLPRLELKAAVPVSSLKRPVFITLFLGLLLILTALLSPGRTRLGLAAMFEEPWRISPSGLPRSALSLTTGDFSLIYTFPAYSELPTQSVSHTNGDIAGLKGTSVRISTRSLEPLKSAVLVTSSGMRLAMKVEDGTRLSVELILSVAGTYHLEGVGRDGELRAERRSHRLVVDEDLPPKIVMLAPVSDVQAAAEGSLVLSYDAADDFGLRELAVVYKRNNTENKVVIKTWSQNGVKQERGQYEWRLSGLNFSAGEKIPFYLEATDNDEVSGGNRGRSETRVLEIFSARQNHHAILAQEDELLNLMIDHLASSLEAWLKDKDGTTDLIPTETELINQAMALVSQLQAVLLELLNDELAEPVVVDALTEMEARYSERVAERQKFLAGQTRLSADQTRELLALRAQYRGELENDILFLDKLIKKQRMDELLAEADELAEARRQLAGLMAEFRRTGDPALLQRIRSAMADLQERWASLLRRMAELRGSLPEEFINADALDTSNLGRLAEQMEKLRQAINDGDMQTAQAIADQLFSDMNRWMNALEENARQTGEMMSREMMQKMENLSSGVADLIEQQQEIEDRIQEIYEQAAERNQESRSTSKAGDQLKQLIMDLQDALFASRSDFLSLLPQSSGQSRPFPTSLRDTRNALAFTFLSLRHDAQKILELVISGNAETALERASELQKNLGTVVDAAREMIGTNQLGPPEIRDQFNTSAGEALALIKKIIDELRRLTQSSPFALSDKELQELQELAGREEALRQQVEETARQYEQMRNEVPSLPGSVSGHFEHASSRMQNTSEELMLGDPGRAAPHSREARMHLEQVKKQLQQKNQQMGQCMSGRRGGGAGGGRRRGRGGDSGLSSTEKVELPDPNAHKGPEQFRKEVLKAMKEPGPEQYQNLNRDYYQRLVK